jgi:hypothetical protein
MKVNSIDNRGVAENDHLGVASQKRQKNLKRRLLAKERYTNRNHHVSITPLAKFSFGFLVV